MDELDESDRIGVQSTAWLQLCECRVPYTWGNLQFGLYPIDPLSQDYGYRQTEGESEWIG